MQSYQKMCTFLFEMCNIPGKKKKVQMLCKLQMLTECNHLQISQTLTFY